MKMFTPQLNPVLYPAQIVTGGGRGSGFKALQYLPWSMLPMLKQTNAWNSLLVLYDRLAASYDNFFASLGFLSPKIKDILQGRQNSYANAYVGSVSDYVTAYKPVSSDIVDAYRQSDYPQAYANLQVSEEWLS